MQSQLYMRMHSYTYVRMTFNAQVSRFHTDTDHNTQQISFCCNTKKVEQWNGFVPMQ